MTSTDRWKAFVLAAVAINLLAFLIVRLAPRPVVGVGAAVDVAITVPMLYFLLSVRSGVQPLVSIVPLVLAGLLRATYLAPGGAWARPVVGAGVELALVTLVVIRVRRGFAQAEERGDVLERLEAAAREIVPARRLAAALASEMAVFYYALAAWRRAPHVPPGARAFSIHRESGAAALFGMLAGTSVIEAALVHLVVMRWSAAAAWGLTALSAYGALWMVAMARSFVLRPVLVEGADLTVRGGMMWTVRVPLGSIAAIERSGEKYDLRTPPASQPNVVVRLSQAVTARGMYGMRRQVASVALAVDDADGFVRALSNGARPGDNQTR